MDTIYKKHSSVKLWIATAMLIFSCLTTSVFAQKTVVTDTVTAVTETITEIATDPVKVATTSEEAAISASDTIGELALGLKTVLDAACSNAGILYAAGICISQSRFHKGEDTANI